MSKMTFIEQKPTAEPEQTETTETELKENTEAELKNDEAGQDDTNKIDYEAKLASEKKRREDAEKAAAEARFKLRERKRQEQETENENEFEDDEDKPLTKKDLDEVLRKSRQEIRKDLQSEIIVEKAKKLADSESEADLIVEIHKNRIFPEGLSLDEQLSEAYAIANKDRIKAKTEEFKRAVRSRETVVDIVAGTYRDTPKVGEPKLNPADVNEIKSKGFIWDGKSGKWRKDTKKEIIFYTRDLKERQVVKK